MKVRNTFDLVMRDSVSLPESGAPLVGPQALLPQATLRRFASLGSRVPMLSVRLGVVLDRLRCVCADARFTVIWGPLRRTLIWSLFLFALAAYGKSSAETGPPESRAPQAEPIEDGPTGPSSPLPCGPSAPPVVSPPVAPTECRCAPAASRSMAILPDGRVVLNEADATDLRKLPSVGEKRAQAILELRARLGGRFKNFAELRRIRGFGPRTLAKFREHAVLDRPEPPKAPDSASPSPESTETPLPAGRGPTPVLRDPSENGGVVAQGASAPSAGRSQ